MPLFTDICLRALEPEDLELIYRIENDPDFWKFGTTTVPYSRYVLRQYLETSANDLFADQQVRLVIEGHDASGRVLPLGLADLTDFSPQHMRAEIALAVLPEYQGQQVGHHAVRCLMDYARRLRLHQIYAIIAVSNKAASKLFQQLGFKGDTTLRDWLRDEQGYCDARLWQQNLETE